MHSAHGFTARPTVNLSHICLPVPTSSSPSWLSVGQTSLVDWLALCDACSSMDARCWGGCTLCVHVTIKMTMNQGSMPSRFMKTDKINILMLSASLARFAFPTSRATSGETKRLSERRTPFSDSSSSSVAISPLRCLPKWKIIKRGRRSTGGCPAHYRLLLLSLWSWIAGWLTGWLLPTTILHC